MNPRKQIRSLASKSTRRFRKNRPDFTSEAGIARRIEENRGQGTGATYKTWLRVPEFGSSGYRRMVWSPRLGRIVHLLSQLEWEVFIYAEFNASYIDIRENFPVPRESTRAIAASMKKRHPAHYDTDIVMTTDFYLTEQTPAGQRNIAWSVKYAKELKNPRVVAKLEIEKAYYKSLKIPVLYRVMTEESLPIIMIENIKFVRGTLQAGAMDGYSDQLINDIDSLMRPLLAAGPLGALCEACDQRLGLEPGSAVRAARYLIASRRWSADMNVPIALNCPLTLEGSK